MITRETSLLIGEYRIAFTVYDGEEWLVSIVNNNEEFGATSLPCQPNWNKGLADAFVNIASMMDEPSAWALLDDLRECKNIDQSFNDYLPSPWRRFTEKEMDAIEAAWEVTWVNGPQ